jgi:hypothetical protein
MPGVGVTDTDAIFALVGAHRSRVFASAVLMALHAGVVSARAAGLAILAVTSGSTALTGSSFARGPAPAHHPNGG